MAVGEKRHEKPVHQLRLPNDDPCHFLLKGFNPGGMFLDHIA